MTNTSSAPSAWRSIGRILIVLAALVTGVVFFYIEEDVRGKYDWEKYRQQAEAKGVNLDLEKFIPAPVPDDQNFAMTPFLKPLLELNPRPFGVTPYRDTNGFSNAVDFGKDFFLKKGDFAPLGQMPNLTAMAEQLQKDSKSATTSTPMSDRVAANFILEKMQALDPVLDELREASRRPYSRFNVHYEDEDPAGILLPHLAVIKKLGQVLQVRASAELALGRPDAAAEDIQLSFRLVESIHDEPFLISFLVRAAMLKTIAETVWVGLARHQWTDAQLQSLQAQLQKISLIKDSRYALDSERAWFGTRLFDYMRAHPEDLANVTENREADEVVLPYAPKGWLYQEQISYHRYFNERLLPGFNADSTQVHPKIVDAAKLGQNINHDIQWPPPSQGRAGSLGRLLHHRVLINLLVRSIPPIFQKAAADQTLVDQAHIACALERCRFAQGKLPESLDALSPKYLEHAPVDVCTGQPLHYKPQSDGQFLLYSVGWNETDDGGNIALDPSKHTPSQDLNQGDWVWPEYPQ